MKKLLYASVLHELETPNDEYDRLKRLTTSGILVGRAVALPRNIDTRISTSVHPIPAWQDHSPITFAEATDIQAQRVIEQAEQNDLPIVVYWSGGIDSTLILSAVIKHFPKELLNRVIVKMSNASYFENPTFFHNAINKNNIAYTRDLKHDYQDAMILHGDPADAIWLGGNVLALNTEYPGIYKRNIFSEQATLIKFLADRSDHEFATWTFNYLVNNAAQSGFNLETFDDFWWWLIFNFNFNSMCIKHIGESKNPPNDYSIDSYNKNFVPWFASDEYQIWSIQAQGTGLKYDGTTRSYKMPAKEYIYEFDGNQHYRDYKTKMHSQYLTNVQTSLVSAIYEGWEVELSDITSHYDIRRIKGWTDGDS